jgi:hypothetical protein
MQEEEEQLTVHLMLLLLLKHVLILLWLQMRMGQGSRTYAWLHTHHRTGLARGTIWAGYTRMHHTLLHRVTRARTAHHVLGHRHAGVLGELCCLHHFDGARRSTREQTVVVRYILMVLAVHASGVSIMSEFGQQWPVRSQEGSDE